MEAIYSYAQIVHLFCAVIFVGYLFFDVVIFRAAKKSLAAENFRTTKESISKVAIKIMPACVFLLILTGGMMMSRWVNSQAGYFDTNLQKLFMIKVVLGFLIFFAVAINLTFKFILKKPSPLGDIHPFALISSLVIVFIAKFMFLV